MANTFAVNVYQIDQTMLARDQSQRIAFPSSGVVFQDVTLSPTRSLASGYNVYGLIIVPGMKNEVNQNGRLYYVQETVSQLTTLAG